MISGTILQVECLHGLVCKLKKFINLLLHEITFKHVTPFFIKKKTMIVVVKLSPELPDKSHCGSWYRCDRCEGEEFADGSSEVPSGAKRIGRPTRTIRKHKEYHEYVVKRSLQRARRRAAGQHALSGPHAQHVMSLTTRHALSRTSAPAWTRRWRAA